MSERKVLNKYFPPDYDPSKIPRGKAGRNSTFIIRLMAPCNMRCTTCGEYIYKGRKFNARKEDVDDMNHLGLRIFRFYIKCTACLSEISFRTDPANTDYVLEAGATRNFEALSKAEKIAEQEQKAYQEELKNNPMKLLEERTEASKNEMDRMEALEELQELNKRESKLNYEEILSNYDRLREQENAKEEEEDEEFVKQVFGKEGGVKIKRIIDNADGSDDDDDMQVLKKPKIAKVEQATDFLTESRSLVPKKEVWEKSVGTFNMKKGALVVKKKSVPVATATTAATTAPAALSSTVLKPVEPKAGSSSLGSLGLLGDYSDSEESN